jgi:hypothetical protein
MKLTDLAEAGWNKWLIDALAMHHLFGVECLAEAETVDSLFNKVLQRLLNALPHPAENIQLWFLLGHSATQSEDRLFHHRKLWKSHGLTITPTSAEHSSEWHVKSGGESRYFGAAKMYLLNEPMVLKLLQEERLSWLLITNREVSVIDIQNNLRNGWADGSQFFPAPILLAANKMQAVLLKRMRIDAPSQEEGIIVLSEQKTHEKFYT